MVNVHENHTSGETLVLNHYTKSFRALKWEDKGFLIELELINNTQEQYQTVTPEQEKRITLIPHEPSGH